MKNSGLNFRIFPVTIGTLFSGISGKEDEVPISQREFPFHLSFLPEFPGFSAEWFDGRKFNNFQKKLS